ncbi:MAG: hypothetical protein RIB47_02895 [Cyclobacteriaceae bacterium]
MMIKAAIFTLLSVFTHGVSEPDDHAIYLSMIEITHPEASDSGELSIKVFVDDFEDALKNEFNASVKFSESDSCTSQSALIAKYFQKRFAVRVNQSPIDAVLTKCEMMGDAIWLRFLFECPRQWNTVVVNANFLMELFPTQSNVVSVKHGAAKQFLNLTNSTPAGTLKF